MPTGKEKDEIILKKFTYCLVADCHQLQGDHGVCDFHRKWMQERIDEGSITWDGYADLGKAYVNNGVDELDFPRDKRLRVGLQPLCIAPECESKAITRGLCATHYQVCRNLVLQKRLTWKILEDGGFALPLKSNPNTTKRFRKSLFNQFADNLCPKEEREVFNPFQTKLIEEKEEAMPQLEEADRHIGRKPPAAIPSRGSHPSPGIEVQPKEVFYKTCGESGIKVAVDSEGNEVHPPGHEPGPAIDHPAPSTQHTAPVVPPAPPVSLPDSVIIGQQRETPAVPQSDLESEESASIMGIPDTGPMDTPAPLTAADLAYMNAKEPEEPKKGDSPPV